MWFFHSIISLMNALVYVELEQGIHYSFGGKHNVHRKKCIYPPINIHRLSYSQNMTTFEAFHYINSSSPLTYFWRVKNVCHVFSICLGPFCPNIFGKLKMLTFYKQANIWIEFESLVFSNDEDKIKQISIQ